MLFVTEDDPHAIDEQFAEEYPALGLKTTSNSGAYWGDGDLRPEASRADGRLTFAVESKTRWSEKYTHCRFYAAEYVKALKQLHRFDRTAIRLLLGYHGEDMEWGISIPLEDAQTLSKTLEGFDVPSLGTAHKISRRSGKTYRYLFLDEFEFDDLYDQIEEHLSSSL